MVRMECPSQCHGGRRPLIAGRESLQRLGIQVPRQSGRNERGRQTNAQLPTRATRSPLRVFPLMQYVLSIGPTDCNHCNCNHKLFQNLCLLLALTIFTKRHVTMWLQLQWLQSAGPMTYVQCEGKFPRDSEKLSEA